MQKILAILISTLMSLLLLMPLASAAVDASSGRADVMSFAGSFNQSVAIPVAPGRAGMQPALALNYSSSMGNGLYGMGWDLDVTRIERETKEGSPLYTNADKFVLIMKGARQALVPVGAGEYRVANESAFLKITKSGDAWVIRDQNNTVYYLGTTHRRGQISKWPVSGGKTFNWHLSRVIDVKKNIMDYYYLNDAHGFRLSKITYGLNNSVNMSYDTKRADVIVSYRSGMRRETRARLIAVKSYAGIQLASSLSLSYGNHAAQNDYRSLLTDITIDDPEGILPSHTSSFSYSRKHSGVATGSWTPVPSHVNNTAYRTKIVENYYFNANGNKAYDRLYARYDENTTKVVGVSNTVVTFPPTFKPSYLGTQTTTRTWQGRTLQTRTLTTYLPRAIVDMHGDGFPDWMVKDTTGNWRLYANTSKGLSLSYKSWVDPAGVAGHRAFYDVNGDGLPDLLSSPTPARAGKNWTVYLNMGDRFRTIGYNTYLSMSPIPKRATLTNAIPNIMDRAKWHASILMDGVTEQTSGMKKRVAYVPQAGIRGMRDYEGNVIQTPEMQSLIAQGLNPGIFEAPPEMVLWTVARIVNSGPNVEARSVAYTYLGAKLDETTMEFRGFANVTQTDEQTGMVTKTTYAQDIVFQGRPTASSTTLNSVLLSKQTTTWASHEYNAGKRHFAYASKVSKLNYDVNGALLSNEETNFSYSRAGLLLSSTAGVGKTIPLVAEFTAKTVNSYARNTQCGTVSSPRTRQVPVTKTVMVPVTKDNWAYRPTLRRLGRSMTLIVAWVNEPVTVMVPQLTKITKTRRVPQTRTRYVPVTTTTMVQSRKLVKEYVFGRWRLGRSWVWMPRLVSKYVWVSTPQTITVMQPQNYTVMVTQTYTIDGPPATYVQMVPQTYYVQVPDPNCFLQAKLAQAQVTKTSPGDTLGTTRTSSFAYDAQGFLKTEVIEPNNPKLKQVTSYTYDSFGNRLTTTVSGAGIRARTTTVAYDINGHFPISTTNALGHQETYVWDARFGKKLSLTGPNGLTTSWKYDGFGRKIREDRADGTFTAIDLSRAPRVVKTTASGSNPSTVWYDARGREIKSATTGFNGTLVYNEVAYDALGRKWKEFLPHKGTRGLFTTYAYDLLSRPIMVTNPNGDMATSSYAGLTVTATNAKGQATTTVKNSQGKVVRVTDSHLKSMTYGYDALGNLTATRDAAGNVTRMSYDIRGRKIGMVDPDMGRWRYAYDTLGNLISQTDAKNQTTTMVYDLLGRMTSRTEAEGTSRWTYDTLWIGALSSETGGIASKAYVYDTFGRVKASNTTINAQLYNVSTTYDAVGRVDTITYPNGFAIKRNYNLYHYLSKITNNGTGAKIWSADTMDEFGHLTGESFGNGVATTHTYDNVRGTLMGLSSTSGVATIQNWSYDYDAVGNMRFRTDAVVGYTENFEYDNLNRLLNVRDAGLVLQKRYRYDAIGNITFKTGLGRYTYDTAHPHAVSAAGGNTYSYDANGNMTSGAGRTHSWTSFNKALGITTANGYTGFAYDANHNRVQKTTPTTVTTYIGKIFEVQEDTVAGLVKDISNVYAGSTLVASFENVTDANNVVISSATKYMHADHLGSISVITDELGQVLKDAFGQEIGRLRFDVFGLPVDPNTGVAKADFGTGQTSRGYTGHEMDASTGLINMNARLYDPVLGRFISADTIIPESGNMQAFNRYAYVLNNPLMYTDPTGHFWNIVIGAVIGGLNAYLNGGDFNDIIAGAIIGGIAAAVGDYSNAWASSLVGDGIAGQVAGTVAGSMASAAVNSAGQRMLIQSRNDGMAGETNVVRFDGSVSMQNSAAGTIGGVASTAGVGKFTNGFTTGAFDYAFNDKQLHGKKNSRALKSPTGKGVRGKDNWGGGHYGASRGSRSHDGVDYVSDSGQRVVAPMSGRVVRHSHPYADDLSFDGIVIRANDGAEVTVWYVDVSEAVKMNGMIAAGDYIGTAQDLTGRYPNITNHVHVRLHDVKGKSLNPQGY